MVWIFTNTIEKLYFSLKTHHGNSQDFLIICSTKKKNFYKKFFHNLNMIFEKFPKRMLDILTNIAKFPKKDGKTSLWWVSVEKNVQIKSKFIFTWVCAREKFTNGTDEVINFSQPKPIISSFFHPFLEILQY